MSLSAVPGAAEPRVLYQDPHLLVLFKPAGLATTSPDGGDCLVERARALDPGAPHLHALSRLDSLVTGLVPFARTRDANQRALRAREARKFPRCYLALAAAGLEPVRGQWVWSIGVDPRDKRHRVALDPSGSGGARRADTRYEVTSRTQDALALRLLPGTGRTHQLRVHASRAGSPLLGDVAYGASRRLVRPDGRVLTARRVMLHCAACDVPDLGVGRVVRVRCAVPGDMMELWAGLGGEAVALDAEAIAFG